MRSAIDNKTLAVELKSINQQVVNLIALKNKRNKIISTPASLTPERISELSQAMKKDIEKMESTLVEAENEFAKKCTGYKPVHPNSPSFLEPREMPELTEDKTQFKF